MASTDTGELAARVRTKARWAYERARLRRALLGVAPLGLTLSVALCFVSRPTAALVFGMAAVAVGVLVLWYGQEPKRAFLLGVVAGIIPLAMVTAASHVHMCGPAGCTSWCIPACCAGGLVSGLLVAYRGYKRRAGVWFWLSASVLALLVGAMGCSCLGAGGLIGLVLGFGVGMTPLALGRTMLRQ